MVFDQIVPAVPAQTPAASTVDDAASEQASSQPSATGMKDTPVDTTTCTSVDFALALSPPPLTALHYGEHDIAARTIGIAHTSGTVSCSHDGGVTFAACDTASSLVFTPEDFTLGRDLVVRAQAPQACAVELHYSPKALHPRAAFHPCDVLIASNESLDALDKRITVANQTLCVAANVVFANPAPQNPDATVLIDVAGVRLLGIEGKPFKMRITTSHGIYVPFGSDDFVLGHADVQQSAISHRAVHLAAERVVLTDVHLEASGTLSTNLLLDQSDVASPTLVQHSSFLLHGSDVAIALGASLLQLEDTSIDADGDAVIAASPGASVSLLRSTILAGGGSAGLVRDPSAGLAASSLQLSVEGGSLEAATGPVLLLGAGSHTTLNDTELTSHGATATVRVAAAELTASASHITTDKDGIALTASTSQASLGALVIRRNDAAPTGGYPLTFAGGPSVSFPGGAVNVFCNVNDAGGNRFAGLTSGAIGAGNYGPAANSTTLGQCP